MNETSCLVCGARAEIMRIAKAFGRDADLLVIEDVPVIVCRTCHEQYIASETLHEIERLRERQQH
jgi:YgiT-type zinc finger domain-containing protein